MVMLLWLMMRLHDIAIPLQRENSVIVWLQLIDVHVPLKTPALCGVPSV